jgi:hypothetical protein
MGKRGGKRPGAGRKPKPKIESPVDRTAAARLLDALNRPPKSNDSVEVAGWRKLWNHSDPRIRLDSRKYLYDKRDGKPVQTVNHLHDKPIEHTHVVSIRGTLEKALQRALNK